MTKTESEQSAKTPAVKSTKNIHQRIAAITAAVGSIKKGGQNKEQNYAYIEYDDVTAALRSLMLDHGITVLQDIKPEGRHVTEVTSKYGAKGLHLLVDYIFTVTNMDDPSDRLVFNWNGEAIDYGDKATNKAATGAEKYFLMKLFKIGSKDDPDRESPDQGKAPAAPPTSPPIGAAPPKKTPGPNDPALPGQIENVRRMLDRLGYGTEGNMFDALKSVYGIEDPEHMTVGDAQGVIKAALDEIKGPQE